jgi:hypothetical protein
MDCPQSDAIWIGSDSQGAADCGDIAKLPELLRAYDASAASRADK